MSGGTIVEIACELRRETEKAYLLFDGTLEAWTPKAKRDGSVLVSLETDGRGKVVIAKMPEWLAREKGLFVDKPTTRDLFE